MQLNKKLKQKLKKTIRNIPISLSVMKIRMAAPDMVVGLIPSHPNLLLTNKCNVIETIQKALPSEFLAVNKL